MELIKRRYLRVGTFYGMNQCKEYSGYGDPESSLFLYNARPIVRREYVKCWNCSFKLKTKVCEKFACTKAERKDGKSVYFEKI